MRIDLGIYATVALGVACSGEHTPDVSVVTGERIELDWQEGQTFFVAARYRYGEVKSEEVAVPLSAGAAADDGSFAERWTDEVVWTYRVVHSDYVPEASDELFEYAVTGADTLAALAVLKVTAEPELNTDPTVLESQPTAYLVFREDTDRLVALIEFTTEGGERVERAWSVGPRGRSWSLLSQASLIQAPTYLAPWSATWSEGLRRLESGRTVETVLASDASVDVFYMDELDGGLVGSRYERGAPWPTWTVAENVESRLLDETSVYGLRGPTPPPSDDDFDYRAALSTSTNIDAALSVAESTIDDGGWLAEVEDGYRPWAGAWWPLKKGELVFGYREGDTLSSKIREEVDPLKREMDELSEKIRDLKPEDEERAEHLSKHKELQGDLVDKLVAFYNDVQADIDGGRLRVEDGQLVHDDGWTLPVEDLSPMDKFALVEHLSGNDYPNPWYLPAWEILNSYNPGGASWWGHCNGWAAAAILTHEPREARTVTVDGTDISFSTADLKGLLSESHYSTRSLFYGERYNGEEDDLTDLTPMAFQRLVSFYIKQQGVPLVFDTTATEAVWNFPAWRVELEVEETTPDDIAERVDINTATAEELDELPGLGDALSRSIVDYREKNGPFQSVDELVNVDGVGETTVTGLRELVSVSATERSLDVVAHVTLTTDGVGVDHIDIGEPKSFTEVWRYTLITDPHGTILRGSWAIEDQHPDFAWVPYNNPHASSRRGSENPYLVYRNMIDQFGDELERQ